MTKTVHMMEAKRGKCTREQLPKQLHYTGEYLNRILKSYTGKTIVEYRRTIVLEESRRLLLDTDMSISEIIEELYLTNRSHFYRSFQDAYGLTPLQYRTEQRSKMH